MGKKKKKQKTQAYIRKILSDGKVTKKEVKEAGNKGIRLSRITGAVTKAAQEGNPFSGAASSSVQFTGANKTKASPAITIAAGAQKLVDRDTAARAAAAYAPVVPQTGGAGADAGADAGAGAGAGSDGATDNTVNPLQGNLDDALGEIDDLKAKLAAQPDFATMLAQQAERDAAQRAADLEAARQQQALFMEEMAARNAELERERRLTFQTSQQNTARAGMRPDFRIGARRGEMYGTGGFKRRRKIKPATVSKGILPTIAEATPNGNLLNV